MIIYLFYILFFFNIKNKIRISRQYMQSMPHHIHKCKTL